MKYFFNYKITIIFLSFLILFPYIRVDALEAVDGYVASSSGYRIVTDTISVGGLLSTSTSYSMESSISPIGSGTGTSTSFSLQSGFLSMAESYLAVSTPANVSMSPEINSTGGGTGNGSTSWTITTDSSGGYSLSIRSSTAPALKSATDSFPNYQPVVNGTPDYNFRTGAGADFFGFTPEGSDITSLYKDDGISSCNTGSSDTTDKCWDSILTSDKTFANGTSSNHPTGTATTVKFRAYVGSSITKTAGSYTATIIVTALAL